MAYLITLALADTCGSIASLTIIASHAKSHIIVHNRRFSISIPSIPCAHARGGTGLFALLRVCFLLRLPYGLWSCILVIPGDGCGHVVTDAAAFHGHLSSNSSGCPQNAVATIKSGFYVILVKQVEDPRLLGEIGPSSKSDKRLAHSGSIR